MEEVGIYFQFMLFTCENQPILTKKPPPLKHILALPILSQECLRSETELIEKVNFDLGHPVYWYYMNLNTIKTLFGSAFA